MSRRLVGLVALCLVVQVLWGCGSRRKAPVQEQPVQTISSSTKVRVADVSNKTGELFDVDVIGLLWGSLDATLKSRGMHWSDGAGGRVLLLEAAITEYQKGNIWMRPVLPMWGNVVLKVKCDVKDGTQVLSTIEKKKVISAAHGGLSFSAYRQVFADVAEEIVNELAAVSR